MKKGFTLIELVIVMAIIAILAAITIGGVRMLRGTAKDSKLIAELRGMQNTLELYYSTKGEYPGGPRGGLAVSDWSSLLAELEAAKLGVVKFPEDPSYDYAVSPDGENYVLGAVLQKYNTVLDNDVDDADKPSWGTDVSCGTQGDAEREYCVSF